MGYTFLKLAEEVLEYANTTLSCSEIWDKAIELGLVEKLSSSGKTPANTLSAQIHTNIRSKNPIFKKTSGRPSKFTLVHKELENNNKPATIKEKPKYKERDLHILLSSFVRANEHFGCLTKTIFHEGSKKEKKGKNKWLHPDIVGVHFPFESYTENTLKLFDILKVNPYKLYSFEMKIELSFSNLRECYFQAVSNSSWAHEGYLVTLHMLDDVDLIDELRRLNNAFGIGVIRLNPEHFMQSEILFSAKERETLDWDTVNRLVDDNPDFEDFLNDLMEDITVGKVKSNYDKTYATEEEAWKKCMELGIN